jgi:hypothetical protein
MDNMKRVVCVGGMGLILLLAITMTTSASWADESEHVTYYADRKQVTLQISCEKMAIVFEPNLSQEECRAVVAKTTAIADLKDTETKRELVPPLRRGLRIATLQPGLAAQDVKNIAAEVNRSAGVSFAAPVLLQTGANKQPQELVPTDSFYVMFKPGVSRSEVDALNAKNNLHVVKEWVFGSDQPSRFVLAPVDKERTGPMDLFPLIEEYYTNPSVVYSTPLLFTLNLPPERLRF